MTYWKNISTYDITELNDLISAGEKLLCEKIGIPLKTTDRKWEPGWELRLESAIKRLRQKARKPKQNIKKYSVQTKSTATRTKNKTWEDQVKNTG